MKHLRRYSIIFLTATVLLVTSAGCRTVVDDGDLDTQPWSAPASWEGQIIGMPY